MTARERSAQADNETPNTNSSDRSAGVVIDEASGLPVLPEGLRWRVREQKEAVIHWNGVQLLPTGRIEVVIEKFWPSEIVTIRHRRVFRRALVETAGSPEAWRDAQLVTPVVVQGLHPVAIANAARRCLKLREQAIARNNLLGAYPPKKLEVPA